MYDEDVEFGTISLVYERSDKRVEMYVSEEPSWPEQIATYIDFLRAVGFFINPEVDAAVDYLSEVHHKGRK